MKDSCHLIVLIIFLIFSGGCSSSTLLGADEDYEAIDGDLAESEEVEECQDGDFDEELDTDDSDSADSDLDLVENSDEDENDIDSNENCDDDKPKYSFPNWERIDVPQDDYQPFNKCVELPARYKGTFQLVNPLPLPKQNYSMWNNNGELMGVGEWTNSTVFTKDEYSDWYFSPLVQSIGNSEVFQWNGRNCLRGGSSGSPSRCAVSCLNKQSDCFECIHYIDNPLKYDWGFGTAVDNEDNILFGARDYVLKIKTDYNARKELVICSEFPDCIVSRFIPGTNFATGVTGSGFNTRYVLYENIGYEWVEVDAFDYRLHDLEVGHGQPLEWNNLVYLYTYGKEEELPAGTNHAFNLLDNTLKLAPFPESELIRYGGLNLGETAIMGLSGGYLARFSSEGITIDKELPGDVYMLHLVDDEFWASGSGFISKWDDEEGWSGNTRTIAPYTWLNYIEFRILEITGSSRENYLVLGGMYEYNELDGIFIREVNGCSEKRVFLDLDVCEMSEPKMAYSEDFGVWLIGSGQKAIYFIIDDEQYHAFKVYDYENKCVTGISSGKTHAFYSVVCDLDSLSEKCYLIGNDPNETFQLTVLDKDATDVLQLDESHVVVSHNDKLSVYNLKSHVVAEVEYPEGEYSYYSTSLNLEITENGTRRVLIGGFFESYYTWSPDEGFVKEESDDSRYIKNVVSYNGYRFVDGPRAHDYNNDLWHEFPQIKTYSGDQEEMYRRDVPYYAVQNLSVIEDRLFAFGTDELILGLDGTEGIEWSPVCESLNPPDLPEETPLCPGQCPEDNRVSTPQCEDGMCYIPGGEFCLNTCRNITLSPYYIDETEVSNAMYRECVDSGSCLPPTRTSMWQIENYYTNPEYDNYPVAYINYNMAVDYCDYKNKRLPTEVEWFFAAIGYEYSLNSCSESDEIDCYSIGMNYGTPVEVDRFSTSRSAFGVYGMKDNVSEWISDYYDPTYFELSTDLVDPEGPQSGEARVVKGGAWAGGRKNMSALRARERMPEDVSSMVIGFRCAKDISN